MTPKVLLSAVLIKCETRGQQLGLVVGSVIIAAALFGISYWMFGMAEAARTTLPEFAELNQYGEYRNSRQRSDLYMFMMMWYAMTGLVALLLPILAAVGLVNLVRLVVNTGLKDLEDW